MDLGCNPITHPNDFSRDVLTDYPAANNQLIHDIMKHTKTSLFDIALAAVCVSATTYILGGIGLIISSAIVLAGLAYPSTRDEDPKA